MAKQCAGAPMAQMFQRLHQDEAAHLSRLEELYESVYLADTLAVLVLAAIDLLQDPVTLLNSFETLLKGKNIGRGNVLNMID
jgi:hypothetical protein